MKYIERNPQKCFSMPSLVGRRLTVHDIVTQIYLEKSLDAVMNMYQINIEETKAALEYCKNLECAIDSSEFQFCDGCILRTVVDMDEFDMNDYFEVSNNDQTIITISKDKSSFFLGSLSELEEDERGQETWKIAESILKKHW